MLNHRSFFARAALLTTALFAFGCTQPSAQEMVQPDGHEGHGHAGHDHAPIKVGPGEPPVGEQLKLSEAEWKSKLSDEEFYILRQSGTERAFTGKYWDHKGHGVYRCAACNAPLFASDTKFKSGTGWPSFYQPVQEGRVAELKDASHGMVRVEVRCARCNGHLGHVFNDGPQPTGQRYCINSASLAFDESKPAASTKGATAPAK